MGKVKISEKITNEHKLNIEGFLNSDDLEADKLKIEVEEVGEVDLKTFLDKFNGQLIKISISEKSEELIEE